jgi:hypothetical protein
MARSSFPGTPSLFRSQILVIDKDKHSLPSTFSTSAPSLGIVSVRPRRLPSERNLAAVAVNCCLPLCKSKGSCTQRRIVAPSFYTRTFDLHIGTPCPTTFCKTSAPAMGENPESTEIEDIPLTDRDRKILEQTDEEYHLFTWDDLKTVICIPHTEY